MTGAPDGQEQNERAQEALGIGPADVQRVCPCEQVPFRCQVDRGSLVEAKGQFCGGAVTERRREGAGAVFGQALRRSTGCLTTL